MRPNGGGDARIAQCQHGAEALSDTADGLPRQRWKRYGNAGSGAAAAFPITRSPGRRTWGRTLAIAVIVALCAGVVSGSCTGVIIDDVAVMAVAGASAAGVALGVASVLFFLKPKSPTGGKYGASP